MTTPTWTCARCEIVVRFMPGHGPRADLPDGWTRREDGALLCVRCAREIAVAETLAEVGLARGDRGADKVRRRVLVELELQRDPDRTAGQVGRSIGEGAAAVGRVISELRRAGRASAPKRETT